MRSAKLLLLLHLLTAPFLHAQQWQWARILPVHGFYNHSAIHPNGTLYVANGAFFYQVNTNGDTLAPKNYSGMGLQITSLKTNTKGNLVIGGYAAGAFTLAGQQWSKTGNYHDLFIAELTTQYQKVWSHIIPGTDHQEVTDLGVDKNDNVYCTGIFRSNFNFLGKQLNGKNPGTSFVAKLNAGGTLAWAHADSSGGGYAGGKSISVNKDGESLVSIESSGCSYFYVNNAPFYPAANSAYYYGDQFALLLKSDGSVIHARSDKNTKAEEYYFTGLTSTNWYRLADGFWNGDHFSELQEYNYAGDTTGGYSGAIIGPEDNRMSFLGVIDDKAYFLWTKFYFDQNGQQFENEISVFDQHQMKHLIKFTGDVNKCRLHKRFDGTFVIDGAFTGKLNLGNLSLTSKMIGLNGNDTIYYWQTFVAAFNPDANTAVGENKMKQSISLFPNPAKDKLCVSGCTNLVRGEVINSLGQITNCCIKENAVDVSHLTSGVYFLKLYTAERVWTTRFVKE